MPDRRRRNRMAARRDAPAPTRTAPAVLPRGGGNGSPGRHVRDVVADAQSTIPVDPARLPRPRSRRRPAPESTQSTKMRPTRVDPADATAVTLQEGFTEVGARLAGIEDAMHGIAHALRVHAGLEEADEELEKLRADNDNLHVENGHLNEQLALAHGQLEQIRTSAAPVAAVVVHERPADVPPSTDVAAPAPTPPPESTQDDAPNPDGPTS